MLADSTVGNQAGKAMFFTLVVPIQCFVVVLVNYGCEV